MRKALGMSGLVAGSGLRRALFETLEVRKLLSAGGGGADWPYESPVPWQSRISVETQRNPVEWVSEGSQCLGAQIKLSALRNVGGAVKLNELVVYDTAGCTASIQDAVTSGVLVAKLNGHQTYVSSAPVVDGMISFSHFRQPIYVGGYAWTPTLSVYLYTSTLVEANPGTYKIGVECEASFTTLKGVELDPRNVTYRGRPTLDYLTVHQTVVTCAFNGPASQTVIAGDPCVLGNLDVQINKSNASVAAHDLFFMVEGESGTGGNLDIEDSIDELMLTNPSTGRIVEAHAFHHVNASGKTSEGNDYQIYLLNDEVILDNWSDWVLRARLSSDVQSNDMFRVRMGLGSGATTTFGGVLPPTEYTQCITTLNGEVWVTTQPEGAIVGNWQVVKAPQMSIKALTTATTDVGVLNQKDILLGAFSINATCVDQLLTGLTINAEQGNFTSVQNVQLWFDTTRDNVVDTIGGFGYLRDGRIEIELVNGGMVVMADDLSSIRAEIHADVSGSLIPFNPAFQMEVWSGEAERLSTGSAVNVTVDNSNQQTLWSFVSQGSLYVTQDTGSTVRPQEMLLGELGDAAMRVRLRAQWEPVDVTNIQFPVTAAAISSIDSLELWKEGETTPFAIATADPSGFIARISAQKLVVQEGVDTVVLVRPRLKNDAAGGVSGGTFTISVGAVQGRGICSSRSLDQNDGDTTDDGEVFVGVQTPGPNQPVVSPTHTLVGSKLANVVNAGGLEAPVPLGSQQEIGRFTLTTLANTNVKDGVNSYVLDTLTFNVAYVNVAMDTTSFTLCIPGSSDFVYASTVQVLSTQMYRVTFTGLADNGHVSTSIASAGSLTVALRVTVTDDNTIDTPHGSGLQTQLELRDMFFSRLDQDHATEKVINGSGLGRTSVNGTRYHQLS